MSKKVKRGGNTEMYSSYTIGVGGDDKARFKYEILFQDYHDLLKVSFGDLSLSFFSSD